MHGWLKNGKNRIFQHLGNRGIYNIISLSEAQVESFLNCIFFQITLLNVHTLYTLNKALHWSRTPCSEANCGTLLLAINTTMEESSSPHILTCSLSSKRGQYYHRIRRVYHLFTSLTIDAKERESREMTSKKRIGLTLSLSFWIITPLYNVHRNNYFESKLFRRSIRLWCTMVDRPVLLSIGQGSNFLIPKLSILASLLSGMLKGG